MWQFCFSLVLCWLTGAGVQKPGILSSLLKSSSGLHLLGPLDGAEGTCQGCQAEGLAVAIRNVAMTAVAGWRDKYAGSVGSSPALGR